MARLSSLAMLAASVAALSGCGGGGTVVSGEPISFEELSAAARTSADATSGRFSFAFTISAPDLEEPLSFSGEGAFDAASERAFVTLDLSSFGALLGGLFAGLAGADAPNLDDPSSWRVEAVQDGDAMYVRFPAVADELPAGKSWVRADPEQGSAVQGFDFSQFEQLAGNDPRDLLDVLRAASGEIEIVGTEELRGVQVTHYRATLDARRYAELASGEERDEGRALADEILAESGVESIPLDVWMDPSGLVRKLTLVVQATEPGTSETAEASMTFELWDYGEDVKIDVPPASQVADAAALGG